MGRIGGIEKIDGIGKIRLNEGMVERVCGKKSPAAVVAGDLLLKAFFIVCQYPIDFIFRNIPNSSCLLY